MSDQESAEPGGESAGQAYPRKRRKVGKIDGFMGHGGQSEMAYHGERQSGEDTLPEQPNAPARED